MNLIGPVLRLSQVSHTNRCAIGSERVLPAQVVLLALGFLGPEMGVVDGIAVECDRRSNFSANEDNYETTQKVGVTVPIAHLLYRLCENLITWRQYHHKRIHH